MTNKKLKIAVTAALWLVAAAAHAQTSPIRPAYAYPAAPPTSGAASVQMGDTPLFFTPFLGAAVGHDDNIFTSNVNERSSTITLISPGFKVDARSPSSVFQLSYQGQFGYYADSEEDNYIDHTARAQLDMAFSPRSFLRVGYDFIRSHDPRGSTDRGISSRPDKYRIYSPNATYAFGAPGAQGRIELYAAEARKAYLNNRETTALGDRKTTDAGGAVYWRVMPKTYLVGEARLTEIRYRSAASPLSGEERRLFGGVSWEATALTTGVLKVGRLEKTFDSGAPSFSGASWEGSIIWSPRTYSTFDFYTARTANESTGLGNFILSDIYGVTWNHAWSTILSTAVLVRYQKDDYQGFSRTDDTKSLGFKVGYRFRRWLTLGAEYNYTQRDSSQGVFEYDRNLYLLTATASM